MKRSTKIGVATFLIALILLLTKYYDKKIINQNDNANQNNHDESKTPPIINPTKDYAMSPTGSLEYSEYLPSYAITEKIMDSGLMSNEEVSKLKNMIPLPWQLYRDKSGLIVKLSFNESHVNLVSNDQKAMAEFREEGYEIAKHGIAEMNLTERAFLAEFIRVAQSQNWFENSTKDNQKRARMTEIFPVMIRYSGKISDKNYQVKLQMLENRLLPMLLIREYAGKPKTEDFSSDRVIEIANKYGVENFELINWKLIEMPRNEDEFKFFESVPGYFNTVTGAEVPYVDAWEKVHSKKYKRPNE